MQMPMGQRKHETPKTPSDKGHHSMWKGSELNNFKLSSIEMCTEAE